MKEIKIYLSSFNKEVLYAYKKLKPNSELNGLLSFGTRKNDYTNMIITDRAKFNGLILDSGAYTLNNAKNSKNTITLRGYIAFCSVPKIYKSFDFVFNFDEDFTLDGFYENRENMNELEKAGINVVPVAHDYINECVDEIGYYIDRKYPIIALGFSEHKKRNKKKNIGIAVKRITNAGLNVHLLGVTQYSILSEYPIAYCDSSSWAQEGLFGNIIWWNNDKQSENKTSRIRFLDKENSADKHKVHIGNYLHRKKFESYIKENFGMTIDDLNGNNKEFNRQIVNIHFFVQLQDEIRKAHIRNGIVLN
ncbi:MAG: hypothetical protein HQK65_13435 [Desulfamplus sp.]|nr:hypothetical protein [Desulfamplus sp.]